MAVSYTHLDVYKRQAEHHALIAGADGIDLGVAIAVLAHFQRAVSYTHLDVYKRQIMASIRFRSFSAELRSTSAVILFMPGTIDVYKRQPQCGANDR